MIKSKNGSKSKFNKDKNHLVVIRKDKVLVLKGWPDLRYFEFNKKEGIWKQKYPSSGLFFINDNNVSSTEWIPLRNEIIKNKSILLDKKDFHEIDIDFDNNPMMKAGLMLSLPYFALANIEKGKLIYTIPEKVRRVICKFTGTHWQLASFVARTDTEDALKILEEFPALGFMIANHRCFTKRRDKYRLAKKMLNMKRKKLMRYFNLPDEQWIVNTLKKIKFEDITISNINTLIAFVKHNPQRAKKGLTSLKSIEIGKIGEISKVFDKIGDDLLLKMLRMDNAYDFYVTIDLLKDIERMSEALSIDRREIKSLKELESVHNNLTMLSYILLKQKRNRNFHPPFAGNDSIFPVKTNTELFEESKRMKNCAFSYDKMILKGRSFIYIVRIENEIGMLEIRKDSNNNWKFNQLRGPYNCEVNEKMKMTVTLWLEKNNINNSLKELTIPNELI